MSLPQLERRVVDLSTLYEGQAKVGELPTYLSKAVDRAGEGHDIVLTGQAPIWLYLTIAHALHGKARRLTYSSPVTGDIVVFNHDPF